VLVPNTRFDRLVSPLTIVAVLACNVSYDLQRPRPPARQLSTKKPRMAIFHLNAKVISRGKGQSAIAAAAYRSGERLRDEQSNELKFYKGGDDRIVSTAIMAPKDAPEWAHDRNRLWNEAERAEKRKDAQLAREIEVSLPHELSWEQREWLVRDFAREAFVRKGYAVDYAIHAPYKNSDERNHHAHLMITRRTLGPDGFSATKDWQFDPKQLAGWREQWANLANRHLERHGHSERIDHRSHEARGVDLEPTSHLGYAANEMAQRGAQSDRMDDLRAVLDRNEIRTDIKTLKAELKQLEKDQAAEQTRQDVARAAAAETRYVETTPYPKERPHEAIQIGHAAAESERKAIAKEHAEAAPERAFGGAARQQTDRITEEKNPDRVDLAKAGLTVLDDTSNKIIKLGDFVFDLLAGAAPAPREVDMKAFVTDPQARKEQQLARLAAVRQEKEAAAAIERIAQDLEKGRALGAQDIRKLTPQHHLQIATFGDDGVRQLVDEARKRDERYWKGDGRERE
jgi:hypothetical protein